MASLKQLGGSFFLPRPGRVSLQPIHFKLIRTIGKKRLEIYETDALSRRRFKKSHPEIRCIGDKEAGPFTTPDGR